MTQETVKPLWSDDKIRYVVEPMFPLAEVVKMRNEYEAVIQAQAADINNMNRAANKTHDHMQAMIKDREVRITELESNLSNAANFAMEQQGTIVMLETRVEEVSDILTNRFANPNSQYDPEMLGIISVLSGKEYGQ